MSEGSDKNDGVSSLIDSISVAVGRAVSWLALVMVVVTFVIVVLRYAFDSGLIWLQESVTWMHAMVFMLGAAYTLQREEHVRVDVFYRNMSARRRGWVNLLGTLLFVFPLSVFFIITSYDYVAASWTIGEVSRDAGGLPYPFVPLLKSTLIVMPGLVGLQGVSLMLRSVAAIRGR